METGDAEKYLEMTHEQRRRAPFALCLQAVYEFMDQARRNFKSRNYEAARKCYWRAVRLLENAHLANEEDEKLHRTYLLKCLSNSAMMNRRLGEWRRAISDCNRGLVENRNHSKLLYQKG